MLHEIKLPRSLISELKRISYNIYKAFVDRTKWILHAYIISINTHTHTHTSNMKNPTYTTHLHRLDKNLPTANPQTIHPTFHFHINVTTPPNHPPENSSTIPVPADIKACAWTASRSSRGKKYI